MASPDSTEKTLEKTIQLVRSAQGGDRGALEALFTRYLPRVQRIVSLRLGWRLSQFADVDDIAQEVLLKAFQGLDRFEEESEGTFIHWLSTCVECEIVDQSRKQKAQKRGEGKACRIGDLGSKVMLSSIFAGTSPTPSQVAQAHEAEEAIEAALLELPKHHREVIVLRQICGMSYEEVAKKLKLGREDTVRKACSRALQALEERLKKQGSR